VPGLFLVHKELYEEAGSEAHPREPNQGDGAWWLMSQPLPKIVSLWAVAPIIIGTIVGLIVSRLMKNKWKARIEVERRHERELRDLVMEESD
jgi:phosphate/sulfate permease